jgi:short-subunit dehydrogenase
MEKDLKGHRALITGASSGLGEQFARQLAERGADLVVAARREDRLTKLAGELEKAHGVRVECVRSDLSVGGAAADLFRKATSGGKPVTILINNAGVGPYSRFLKESREKHVGTVQLNSVALTELCHLFSQHMLDHGKRSYLVNVGSIASFQGAPNFAVYSATKAYVRVFSEILGRELDGTNVTVTCLCPGGALTEFSETNGQALKSGAQSMMMTAEAVVRAGICAMLAGRSMIVPGFMNKLAVLAPRFLPSGLALTLAGAAMDRNVDSVKGK